MNRQIMKKNLVAAAVLVTVCAGIYINWLYTEDQAVMDLTDTLDANKILASDTLVVGMDDPATDEVTDYFAAVRLSRQEARDSAVSLIQEAMSYDSGNTDTADRLDEIIQTALVEAQIESLVIAKGYVDCVAYISENGISVAVAAPEGGLQDTDVAVIADIVLSQSDFELDNIHVIEVR